MGKKATKKTSGIGFPSVKKFPLDQLKAAAYNPRVISDGALEGLTNSIKRFGCVEPIVVNVRGGRNVIIGGHQRFKVLEKMGIAESICVTVDCSAKDEKILNLTLNNPEIQGRFDKNIGEYIEQLRAGMPESDFLDLRITNLLTEMGYVAEKVGNVPDDDVPKPARKSDTRPGDLWILGEHRLLCGDSTVEADVKRLMDRKKASLFATDPPYFVDYSGDDRPQAGRDWTGVYREVDIQKATQFLKDFYSVGLKHVKNNTAMYLWYADRRRRLVEDVCAQLEFLIHQNIIWVKPCILLGYSFFPWRHEPCLFMWQRGTKPVSIKGKSNDYSTVWKIGFQKDGDPTMPEYYADVWELDYEGKKRPSGIEHPTIKPVEVFAIPMRVHTNRGDICYEPFSGSGTQIIAAEKLGRRCYAIEKEAVFVDVAVKRWEAWTGRKATKAKRSRQSCNSVAKRKRKTPK